MELFHSQVDGQGLGLRMTEAREVPAEAMGIDGIPGEHCAE